MTVQPGQLMTTPMHCYERGLDRGVKFVVMAMPHTTMLTGGWIVRASHDTITSYLLVTPNGMEWAKQYDPKGLVFWVV